jgi:hypothetical protein
MQEMMCSKSVGYGDLVCEERKPGNFDFSGFEVVGLEMFSTRGYPSVTLKSGSIVFNVYAIRKFSECRYIQILANSDKKSMIIKPCNEDEKNAMQWSKEDKNGKIVPKTITNKAFIEWLYDVMNRDAKDSFKMFGHMQKYGNENMFVFD